MQDPFEKPLSCSAIAFLVNKHIYHLAVLINGSPKVVLHASDFHKDLIDVECITESLILSLTAPRMQFSELVTPKSNSFVAHINSALGE